MCLCVYDREPYYGFYDFVNWKLFFCDPLIHTHIYTVRRTIRLTCIVAHILCSDYTWTHTNKYTHFQIEFATNFLYEHWTWKTWVLFLSCSLCLPLYLVPTLLSFLFRLLFFVVVFYLRIGTFEAKKGHMAMRMLWKVKRHWYDTIRHDMGWKQQSMRAISNNWWTREKIFTLVERSTFRCVCVRCAPSSTLYVFVWLAVVTFRVHFNQRHNELWWWRADTQR